MKKSLAVLGLILSIMLLNLSAFASNTKVSGEKIYSKSCSECHRDGQDGAPKFNDKQSWEIRLQKGLDKLVTFVLRDAYHPRCKNCKTSEVIAAVKYMANNSHSGGNYVLW